MGSSRATRAWSTHLAVAAAASAITLAAGCGDDDSGDQVSPGSLQELLPPATSLGPLEPEPQRSFEWDNPIDYVHEGFFLPQATPLSAAVDEISDAGFEAAAGAELSPKGGGDPVIVSVARFESPEGAAEAQSYLHAEDLKQPCFAACTVNPTELELTGIPGATATHLVPLKDAPPEAGPPFEAYAVEFVVGSDLFYANAGGPPGDISEAEFERGAGAFYEHAREREQ
jgi:hypothetical protein